VKMIRDLYANSIAGLARGLRELEPVSDGVRVPTFT
jgi:hypothetical protein